MRSATRRAASAKAVNRRRHCSRRRSWRVPVPHPSTACPPLRCRNRLLAACSKTPPSDTAPPRPWLRRVPRANPWAAHGRDALDRETRSSIVDPAALAAWTSMRAQSPHLVRVIGATRTGFGELSSRSVVRRIWHDHGYPLPHDAGGDRGRPQAEETRQHARHVHRSPEEALRTGIRYMAPCLLVSQIDLGGPPARPYLFQLSSTKLDSVSSALGCSARALRQRTLRVCRHARTR